jgi:hypothetical protein
MNSLICRHASLVCCATLAALNFLCATGQADAQEQARPLAAEDLLAQRFAELQTELDRLKAAGDKQAADALAVELTRARSLFDGEFKVESSDVPELHAVAVRAGGTAPPGVLKGNDGLMRGYAEISVTYTAAPIILCASAADRLHLQFKVAPGVRLAAVIFGGRFAPTVDGLPEGTLVLNRAGDSTAAMAASPMSWGDAGFQQAAQLLREYTGKELLTVAIANRYEAGSPVIVGPENKTWRAQYLIAQTADAHRRAADFARAEQIKRFAGLRFRALYYQATGPHGHEGTAAEGEFTIGGPLIDTLKPIDKAIRHLVHEPKSGLDFAINHQTELIVVDLTANEYPKVPLDASFTGEFRFSTLAFDTKRNRLVLNNRHDAAHGVYAYDLEGATWKLLAEKGPNLAALTYVPEKDEFWGVTHNHPRGKNIGAAFVRMSPDGQVTEQFQPPQHITNTFSLYGGTTLVVHDDVLIVVTPPDFPYESRRNPDADLPTSHVHVVDRKKQEVIYSGRAIPHDGKTTPTTTAGRPAPSGKGLLHRLFDRLALADATIQKLREQGQAQRALEMAGQLQKLRDRLGGRLKAEPNAKPQVHLVGAYDAKDPVVELTPQPAPLILVLSSYERAAWTVRAAEGVKIERIILGGHHVQSIKASPPGVPVDIFSSDDNTNGFYTHGVESDGHTHALNRIKELTGMEPKTRQGAYEIRNQPIVVGDKNSSWLVQSVVAELEELLKGAMNERQAARRKELERLTFFAPYRTGIAGQRLHMGGRLQYGKFTIRGPMPQTLLDVPDRMEQIATDPLSGDQYLRRGPEIYHLNGKTGVSKLLDWDRELPRLSWPAGIAFDTLRQRLLLNSYGGGGYLYAYDVGQKKWSVICKPGLSTNAMIYVPAEDAIYAVNLSRGPEGVQLLRKFNGHGAVIETYRLPHSIRGGHMARASSNFDLAYVDGRIAILGPTVPDPLDESALVPQIHVFDLESRRFVYTGLLRPHPGVADLSAERLGELWQLLADRDDKKAERATWDMAAGHAAAVEYVAGRLPPLPKLDEAQVRKAIADLDSDDFAVRKQAQERLAAWGGQITPLLEAQAKNPSAEVRATIRRLLEAVEQNVPASPELAREVRAVKMLELIATPEAVQLLDKLASATPGAERTRAAKDALDRLAKSTAAANAAQ